MDVDLDGYQDLLISAGHFKDTQDEDADASFDPVRSLEPRMRHQKRLRELLRR